MIATRKGESFRALVLGRFDHILDVNSGSLTISIDKLNHAGHAVPLPSAQTAIGDMMTRGIPIR